MGQDLDKRLVAITEEYEICMAVGDNEYQQPENLQDLFMELQKHIGFGGLRASDWE